MLTRSRQRGAPQVGEIPPVVASRTAYLPIAWVVIFFVSDIKFSGTRSTTAAATGTLSGQILLELAAYGLVFAWTLRLVHATRIRLLTDRFTLALFAFGALCAVSALWSPIPLFSFVRGWQVAVVSVLTLAHLAVWRRFPQRAEEQWHRAVRGMVCGVGVLSLWAVVLPVRDESGRLSWFGTHPAGAAAYAAVALAVLLLGGRVFLRVPRPVYVGLLVVCTYVLVRAETRAALAGVALALLVAGMRASPARSRSRRRYWMFVAGGACAVLWSWSVLADYLSRGQSEASLQRLNGRTELWGNAWELLRGHRVFGLGFGSSRVYLPQTVDWGAGHAHNAVMELLLSVGFVGTVLGLVCFVWPLHRLFDRTSPRRREVVSLAVLLVFTVDSMAQHGFALPGAALAGCALAVVGLSRPRADLSPRLGSPPSSLRRPLGAEPTPPMAAEEAFAEAPEQAPQASQHQHRLTDDDVRALVAEYLAGSSIRQLAVRYRCSRTTVTAHLDRQGVPRRVARTKLSAAQIAEAGELYEQGAPLAQLGPRFGVAAETLRRAFLRAGVTIRPRRGSS